MKHLVSAVKTGQSLHDVAELALYTPAAHAKLCPLTSFHGDTITPEANAQQVAFFLREHLSAETVAILARELAS